MKFEHTNIEITEPAPDRYVITGFPAASIYIKDVGNLAPPQTIDLPMSPDLADALEAILADYRPAQDEVDDGPTVGPAYPPKKEHWRTKKKREEEAKHNPGEIAEEEGSAEGNPENDAELSKIKDEEGGY